MAAYSLVVFSGPVEGREDEYNDWYTNRHLDDVLRIPGIVSARRYKVAPGQGPSRPYLALYNVETDDIGGVFAEMGRRANTDIMPISDAMEDPTMTIFEAITPLVKKKN